METLTRKFTLAEVIRKVEFEKPSCNLLNTTDYLSTSFHGVSTRQEALDILQQGKMRDTAQLISEEARKAKLKLKPLMSSVRQFVPSYTGKPVITAALAGLPRACIKAKRKHIIAPKKIVNVQIEGGFSAYTSKEEIQKKGIVANVVVALLEANGYGVNLNTTFTAEASGLQVCNNIQIKKSGQQVSNETLAFTLCHSAMLRVIVFRLFELESQAIRNRVGFFHGGGYGIPSENRLPETDIYISSKTIKLSYKEIAEIALDLLKGYIK